MASLADIRAQHPEYNDLSDQQLADGLYRKHYSDMPREEFDRKVGLAISPAASIAVAATPGAPRPQLQAALDAKAEHDPRGAEAQSLKPSEFELSVGTGIARLPGRLLGALGDIIGVAKPIGAVIGNEARKLTGKEPLSDLSQVEDPLGAAKVPTSENVLDIASTTTGVQLHQPEGAAGTAGEFVGGALLGPKLPTVAKATVPAAAVPTAIAAKTPKTLPQMKAATDVAYTTARDAGITVYRRPFSSAVDDTLAAAEKAGFNDIAQASKGYKQTKGIARFLDKMSRRGVDLSGEELDQIRQEFGDAFKAAKTDKDRRILTIMKDQFDASIDAMLPGTDIVSSKMAPAEAMAQWKKARATKTAEETAKSVEKTFGGKTSAQIQKQAEKWLADPRRMARLKPEEQDLVRQMATVSKPEALANLLGRVTGGPLSNFLAIQFLGPVGAVPAAATVTRVGAGALRTRRAHALSDIVRSAEPAPAAAAPPPPPALPPIPEPAGLLPPPSRPFPYAALISANQAQRQP